MTLWQKFDEILQCGNFDVDFKTLISVAFAIWGKIDATPYVEDTRNEFYERKQIILTPLFSMNNLSRSLGYSKSFKVILGLLIHT